MKDPLHFKEICYDILGVSETANKNEVEAAALARIAMVNRSKLASARKIILTPEERINTDIFLFDNTFLSELGFELSNAKYLLTEKRGETARLWEGVASDYFPDYSSIHSLAVLWYWWAVFLEEAQLSKESNSPINDTLKVQEGISADDAWKNTIAYWVFLINSKDFWNDWCSRRYSLNVQVVQENLPKLFTTLFSNYAEKYGNIHSDAQVKRFRDLELVFMSEMSMAKRLIENNITIECNGLPFSVCLGKLLLEKLNRTHQVTSELEKALKNDPGNEKLKSALMGLSEFGNIAALLGNKKYEEVISCVQELPQQKQNKAEVKKMLAEAYHEKGKQHFSAGQYKEAMECWKSGISTGQLNEEIRKTVIADTTSKAGALTAAKPDAAIELLELAHKVVDDKNLNEILGDMLVQKAIKMIRDAQAQAEKNSTTGGKQATDKVIKEINKGIKLLEKAVKLGCKRADENLKGARNILAYIESGFMALNTSESEAMSKAESAAANGDFNSAIAILEKVCTNSSPDIIKQSLAFHLNSRGVNSVSQVMEKVKTQKPVSLDEGLVMVLSSGKSTKSTGTTGIRAWAVLLFLIIPAIVGLVNSFKENGILGIIIWILLLIVGIILLLIRFSEYSREILSSTYGNLYNSAPKCKVSGCSSTAQYVFKSLTFGEVELCASHSEALKNLVSPRPNIDQAMMAKLHSAVNDFQRACGLYPAFNQAAENLNQTQSILNNLM